jgi:ferredoxin/flavodoxin---NADP+ reductase
MAALGTEDNPLRVAIVGAGPSGFYAAEDLLKTREQGPVVDVDLYDRLPTPFGLVRGGVAPDHPKIKSVIKRYEKTARMPGFRFFGNVTIGEEITHEEMSGHYHAVIYTCGAETDRKLGIPGEELPGSHAATEFVGWYNAHPDHADHSFDLSCERAVVIGNGNVAMDVARMLALPREELIETDTADHAIEEMAGSSIREIVVFGRRGPAQAAFTNPELRELGELSDADLVIDSSELDLDEISDSYISSEEADATHKKNVELLRQMASQPPRGKRKRVVLRFLSSPIEIKGDGKVESITIGINRLVEEGGKVRAEDTGEREELECGLVFRSVGYTGVPVAGVPFDQQRGTIANERGRVLGDGGEPVPGLYTAGWIKRGPNGVIGTNKKDAAETVAMLREDLEAGRIPARELPDPSAIEELIVERDHEAVTYAGWEAIDAAESAAGDPYGRPRIKFVRIADMLEHAKTAASSASRPGASG